MDTAEHACMEYSSIHTPQENGSLENGENVYLRGFGSFIIKTRAEKTGRNISKNVAIKIPAHNIPAFKPAKIFVKGVKSKVSV